MFNINIDYKPTYTELVSFFDTTDFHAPVLLNDYAEKVLYNATFISIQDENDTLKGLSITYMNRPQKDYAYLTYIAICKDVREMGGVNDSFFIQSRQPESKVSDFCDLKLKNKTKSQGIYTNHLDLYM